MLAPHVLALLAALTPVSGTSLNCRVFPGDDQWPTTKDWNTLNKTVSGRLVATVPIAAQCHYPNYNQEACKYVQDNWHKPPLQ